MYHCTIFVFSESCLDMIELQQYTVYLSIISIEINMQNNSSKTDSHIILIICLDKRSVIVIDTD